MRRLAWVLRWVVLGVCCALPLAWSLGLVVTHPITLQETLPTRGRGEVLGLTLLVNLLSATLATLLAAGVFASLRRSALAQAAAAVALAMPGLVWAYAGAEALRWLGPVPPQSWPDVARGIVSLGLWLWPIAAIALAALPTDADVLDAADLDGVRRRMAWRLRLPAVFVGWAATFALATGTFAVWDASGIRVTATVMRTMFDTGTFAEGVMVDGGSPDARAAAAIAVGLPTMTVTLVAAFVGLWLAKRHVVVESARSSREPAGRRVAAVGCVVLATLPVLVLVLNLPEWSITVSPHLRPLLHGIGLALLVGAIAAGFALTSLLRPVHGSLLLAIATFLLGGQLLAIAWINLLNRALPMPLQLVADAIYEGDAVVVLTHVGRFGWLGLAAGLAAWTPSMRQLRQQAAVDGANVWQTALHVVWPLTWATILAACLGAAALAVGEVQATVLLVPDTLPPRMATWLHLADDRNMTEASLVLAGGVAVLALTAGVVWRRHDGAKRRVATSTASADVG